VLRLPFAHVLHILNTVCSTLSYRIWGHSFIERAKLSVDDEVKSLGSSAVFYPDPRLNFLNFDLILTSKNAYTKEHTSVLPLCGLLKFIKSYMDLVSQIHFFTDSGSEDVVRRTSEGLPLTTSFGVRGFITWMDAIIKEVILLFPPNLHLASAGALSVSDAAAGVSSVGAPSDGLNGNSDQNHGLLSGSGALSTFDASDSDVAGDSELSSSASASKPVSIGLMVRLKGKGHSFIGARPFFGF